MFFDRNRLSCCSVGNGSERAAPGCGIMMPAMTSAPAALIRDAVRIWPMAFGTMSPIKVA
jgi:hypothetical protein